MCAERVWFQCHRMLVSDWLVAHGHTVLHIDAEGPPKPHRMTAEARLIGNQVVYSPESLFPVTATFSDERLSNRSAINRQHRLTCVTVPA